MKPIRLVPILLLLTSACAQRVIVREVVYVERPAAPSVQEPARPPAADVEAVLAVAREHLGRKSVRVGGQSFRYDCSGFTTGAYSVLGIDLMSLGDELHGANGVALIHGYNERYGRNHRNLIPSPGDVAYFDNTWDKNGNGRLDDPLTHIGIVESVDPDGTIHLIHLVGRGIVRDPMNLRRPHDRTDENGKPINAWLRAKSGRDPPDTPRLMGELFAGFGTVVQTPARVSSTSARQD